MLPASKGQAVLRITKSVSDLKGSGNLLLAVKRDQDKVHFGVFEIADERLRFLKLMPSVSGNAWDLSESGGVLACVGWENGLVSVFDAVEGELISGFRVAEDSGILLFDGKIRVAEPTSIREFDLHGQQTAVYPFDGCFVRDIGCFFIVDDGSTFQIRNGIGKKLTAYDRHGLGITSASSCAGGFVISESRGPVTLFDENGVKVWQNFSPAGFHPIVVATDSENRLFALHADSSTLAKSILTVYDVKGAVIAECELDYFSPVRTFSPKLPGWIFGDLNAFKFEDGVFRRISYESVKATFGLEK